MNIQDCWVTPEFGEASIAFNSAQLLDVELDFVKKSAQVIDQARPLTDGFSSALELFQLTIKEIVSIHFGWCLSCISKAWIRLPFVMKSIWRSVWDKNKSALFTSQHKHSSKWSWGNKDIFPVH